MLRNEYRYSSYELSQMSVPALIHVMMVNFDPRMVAYGFTPDSIRNQNDNYVEAARVLEQRLEGI